MSGLFPEETPSGSTLVSDHYILSFPLVAYGKFDCMTFKYLKTLATISSLFLSGTVEQVKRAPNSLSKQIVRHWKVLFNRFHLERFSFECRKNQDQLISQGNCTRQLHSPMNQSEHGANSRDRHQCGKTRASKSRFATWLWFCFSLAEKMARILLTNHSA